METRLGRVFPASSHTYKGVLLHKLLVILLCLLPAFVVCTTRTVSLDGSQQYTTIQAAVNASVNGDIKMDYITTH